MPILFIHGVNVRSRDGFFELAPKLRSFVAPVIANDPEHVLIDDAFWGADHGVNLAHGGISRPRTRLIGQGADRESISSGGVEPRWTAIEQPDTLSGTPTSQIAPEALTSGRATGAVRKPPARLRDLSDDELADVLAMVLLTEADTPAQRADLTIAADRLAHDPTFRNRLRGAASSQDELDRIVGGLKGHIETTADLVAHGADSWLRRARERLSEVVDRAVDLPTMQCLSHWPNCVHL